MQQESSQLPTVPRSFDHKQDEFWLSTSMDERIGPRHLATKRRQRRFDLPSKPVKFPLKLGLKDVNEGSDTSSMSSYAVLSDDTEDDTPPSPPPTVERLTAAQEHAFFKNLYDIISESFDQWETELEGKGLSYSEMKYEDRFINLPVFFEKDVVMGKMPDGGGFWTGGFRLRGRTELHRLITNPGELVFGFQLGWIEEFSCRTYAVLLIGNDKNVYYYDADGDIVEAEDGDWSYYANGLYDLRKFGTKYVLDPYQNSAPANFQYQLDDGVDDLISLYGGV